MSVARPGEARELPMLSRVEDAPAAADGRSDPNPLATVDVRLAITRETYAALVSSASQLRLSLDEYLSFKLTDVALQQTVKHEMEAWLRQPARRGRRAEHGLTPRQAVVLTLLAQGLTNKAIAQRLGVSSDTVNDYVRVIFEKLGVNTRVTAAVLAAKAGLV